MKQWLLIGGIVAVIGIVSFFINNLNNSPLHKAISVEDVAAIKSWGNNDPNEKEREESEESIGRILSRCTLFV